MKLRYFFIVVIAALMAAGASLAIKVSTQTIDPFIIALLRYGVTILMLFPFIDMGERKLIDRSATIKLLAISFFGVFLSEYLYLTGLKYSSTVDCSLIMATNPIFTFIAAVIFLGEAVSFTKVGAFLMSLFGVALIILDGNIMSTDLLHIQMGEILMLGASLAWVTYNILLKKLCKTFSPFFVVFCIAVISTCCFIPFALNAGMGQLLVAERTTLYALFYITVIATGLGYPLYSYLIKHIGPTMTSFFIYSLRPLFVASFAPFFLGTRLDMYHLAGGALIIGALVLNTFATRTDAAECPPTVD